MTRSSQTARRSNRSNVMLKATLDMPGASIEVVLRNLSQDGALVRADELPAEGTRVLFHRQGLSVPARIAWLHGDLAGVAFEESLYPGELLRHIPPSGPKPSLTPELVRRPGFSSRPLSDAERKMVEEWASGSTHVLGR